MKFLIPTLRPLQFWTAVSELLTLGQCVRDNSTVPRSLSLSSMAIDRCDSLIAPRAARLRSTRDTTSRDEPRWCAICSCVTSNAWPFTDRRSRNAATRCSRPRDAVSCIRVMSSKSRVVRVFKREFLKRRFHEVEPTINFARNDEDSGFNLVRLDPSRINEPREQAVECQNAGLTGVDPV